MTKGLDSEHTQRTEHQLLHLDALIEKKIGTKIAPSGAEVRENAYE